MPFPGLKGGLDNPKNGEDAALHNRLTRQRRAAFVLDQQDRFQTLAHRAGGGPSPARASYRRDEADVTHQPLAGRVPAKA